jgi:hypothetical protein
MFTYLLRATTVGTYEITLSGTSQTNSNFAVWFGNQLIKSGLALPTTGSGNISVPFQVPSTGIYLILFYSLFLFVFVSLLLLLLLFIYFLFVCDYLFIIL